MTSRISSRFTDGLAEVILDSAVRSNALDLDATTQLLDVARQIAELDGHGLRAVFIRAEGRHFCVGGDLREFNEQGDQLGEHLLLVTDALHEALEILRGLSVPVVAAAQGAIAGAGVGLAFASDIVILAENSSITLAYTGAGLSPDNGSSYLLPRLLGPHLSLELMLTNRRISAQQAYAWGLAAEVVELAELDDAARKMVDRILAGSTEAFVATKKLVRASSATSLPAQLANEAASISSLATTSHAREALRRFAQR